MNTVQKFEQRYLETLTEGKKVPDFSPGDTVKVNVKVREGERERIQAYEGVCIGRSGSDINATFTVRKISMGEGVERVFPLWSNRLDSIEVVRRGDVRRAKLYYLRDRRGKSARISERTTGHGFETPEDARTEGAPAAAAPAEKKAKAPAAKKPAAKKEKKSA